ncbi:hypothetical protein CWB91_23240, partial [Pseudoalteromonas piscicida]
YNPKGVGSNPAPATNICWMYKVSSTRLKIKYKYRRGMEQNDKSFVGLAKPGRIEGRRSPTKNRFKNIQARDGAAW